MACHLPLSVEAQSEARTLMLSAHNILAPKDGKPVAVPTQDMVLGAYYLTLVKPAAKGEGKIFSNYDEVMLAYDAKAIDIEALIKVRIPGHGLIETTAGKLLYNYQIYEPLRLFHTDKVMVFTNPEDTVFAYENGLIDTTHFVKIKDSEGRILDYGFSALKEKFGVDLLKTRPLPARKVDKEAVAEFKKDKEYVDVNCLGVLMNKKQIGKLVDACFHLVGNTKTAELLITSRQSDIIMHVRPACLSLFRIFRSRLKNGISLMPLTSRYRMYPRCTYAVLLRKTNGIARPAPSGKRQPTTLRKS